MIKRVSIILLLAIMSISICSCSNDNASGVNVHWDKITETTFDAKNSRLKDSYIGEYVAGNSDVPIYPYIGYTTYAERFEDINIDKIHSYDGKSCRYGFINENGVIVSDPVYLEIVDFGDVYFAKLKDHGECTVISKDGQRVYKFGDAENYSEYYYVGNYNDPYYITIIEQRTNSALILDWKGNLIDETHFEEDSKYSSSLYDYYGKYIVNKHESEVYDTSTGESYYLEADTYSIGLGNSLIFKLNGSLNIFDPELGKVFPDNYYQYGRVVPVDDGYYFLRKAQGGYDIRNASYELLFSIDCDYCYSYDGFVLACNDTDSREDEAYTYSYDGQLLGQTILDWSPDTTAYFYHRIADYNRSWICVGPCVYDKNLNVICKSPEGYQVFKDLVNDELYIITPTEIKNHTTGKTKKFSDEFVGAIVDTIYDGKIYLHTDEYYYLIDMKGNVYFSYKRIVDFDFFE